MHSNVDNSIIYICQDMGATQISISRWMDNDVVCVYIEYYSAIKWMKLCHHSIMNGPGGHYAS